MVDLEARFRMMDQFGEYRQVISLAPPPIESFAGPEVSPRLASIANDGMAELVDRHPYMGAMIPSTQCGLAFFGVDRVLFASDSPSNPRPASISGRPSASSKIWV